LSAPSAAELRRRLRAVIGPRAPLLKALIDSLREVQQPGYLVGGPVRDLILGQPIGDLDVLVPESVEAVARELAVRAGGRAVQRPRFRTATVESRWGSVDFVAARREHYSRPGALPAVEAGPIDVDLGRRDFSVNCLALPITSRERHILDPHGGFADLKAKRLRVLHDQSFVDDPTRLFRAVRYSARLGLKLESGTLKLVRDAVTKGRVSLLSPARVLHEIQKLIAEAKSAPAVAQTAARGLLAAASPNWKTPEARTLRRFDRLKTQPPWPGARDTFDVGLALLLGESTPQARKRVLERLGLSGKAAARPLAALSALRRHSKFLAEPRSPGALDARLAEEPADNLVFLHCVLPAAGARQLVRFSTELRPRPSPLSGRDAVALGVEGPAIGAFLRAARTRALDGKTTDDTWRQRWLRARR